MAALHIVLWDDAVVLDSLFREVIHRVGLLQKGVTYVLFVLQNLPECFRPPPLFIGCRQNSIGFKSLTNLLVAGSFQVFPIDPLYNLGLLRFDDQPPILVFCICKETVMVNMPTI